MAEFTLDALLELINANPEAKAQLQSVLNAPEANPWTPITPEQKVQHFTKLITHGMKPAKPYVYQAWPTTMFHPTKAPRVVKDETAARALGPEWQKQPYEDMPSIDETVFRGDEVPVSVPTAIRRKPGRPAKLHPVEG